MSISEEEPWMLLYFGHGLVGSHQFVLSVVWQVRGFCLWSFEGQLSTAVLTSMLGEGGYFEGERGPWGPCNPLYSGW